MARMSQGMAPQAFPQGVNLEFVPLSILDFGVVFRIWGAVRQCVILIGFLGVGVGTNLEGRRGYRGRGGERGSDDGGETIGGHPRLQSIGTTTKAR